LRNGGGGTVVAEFPAMTKQAKGMWVVAAAVGALVAARPGSAAAQDTAGVALEGHSGLLHSSAVKPVPSNTDPAFMYAGLAPRFWIGPFMAGLEGDFAHDMVFGRWEGFAGGLAGLRFDTGTLVIQAAAEGGEHWFLGIGSYFLNQTSNSDASLPYVGGQLSIAGHSSQLGLSMGVMAFARWDQGQKQTSSTYYTVGGNSWGLALTAELGGRPRPVASPIDQPAEPPARI
jgi:hypothetical protein